MQIQSLADLKAGQTAAVQQIACTETLRSRLCAVGLIPGTSVTCVHVGAGIAAYRIRGAIIGLRCCDAANIRILL